MFNTLSFLLWDFGAYGFGNCHDLSCKFELGLDLMHPQTLNPTLCYSALVCGLLKRKEVSNREQSCIADQTLGCEVRGSDVRRWLRNLRYVEFSLSALRFGNGGRRDELLLKPQ